MGPSRLWIGGEGERSALIGPRMKGGRELDGGTSGAVGAASARRCYEGRDPAEGRLGCRRGGGVPGCALSQRLGHPYVGGMSR